MDGDSGQFDFANRDPEVRWRSHRSLLERWLGPPQFAEQKIDPTELTMPSQVRRYHELIGRWSADNFGDAASLLPVDSFATHRTPRSDGLIPFAGSNHAGFLWVTEDTDGDGRVWMVDGDAPVADGQRVLSASLIDELVRITLYNLLYDDEMFGESGALQPLIASGQLATERIDFLGSDEPFTPFVIIEGELLLERLDVNGKAFGLVAARPGTVERWHAQVKGQLSSLQVYTRPTAYTGINGTVTSSYWLLDVNPDGSGFIQHGDRPRNVVRQWFRAGTIDVQAIIAQCRENGDQNPVRICHGRDELRGSLDAATAEDAFDRILTSFDSIQSDISTRLIGAPP